MELLYFLENLRAPFFDTFFSLITHLGEETIFLAVAILVFWCINKTLAYYIFMVGLTGTVANQFLKIVCRIPRPWVKDPNFTIVESARSAATGYSFPSGHTQSAIGLYGSLARWYSNKWIRIPAIIICILVPLSRLYLGVHTPYDVGTSIVIALAMVFGFYPLIRKSVEKPNNMRYLLGGLLVLCLAFLAYVNFAKFPLDIDATNLNSAVEHAYKLLGAILGLVLTYECDTRYLHFDTHAVWWAQLLKTVLGLAIVLAIKALLKAPLYAIIGPNGIADLLRYFLVVAVAGVLWPMTFKFWGKLGRKAK
ncbi:MAG: phosphatase PAP2 family protein [Clostridiales bacterium]|nr:phosphatase PAP2 family protein [Clostridiales bacterium]